MTDNSSPQPQQASPEALFEKLAANGFDFLLRAAQLLPDDPKLSLVSFAIGLELLLKSRLLLEHWSLVLAKPEEASRTKFLEGDFQSVNIDQAIHRLEKVSNLYFDPKQKKAFSTLRKHRNQVVHFFHNAFSSGGDTSELEKILVEQFRGWFYLRVWTLDSWGEDFHQFGLIAAEIDKEFRRHRGYLKVRFEAVAVPLKRLTDAGARISSCPSCGFQSMTERADGPWRGGHCLVCDIGNVWLELDCPHCGNNTKFEDITNAHCDSCGAPIALAELVGEHGAFEIGTDAKEGFAYCMACEYSDAKTVVTHGGGYLCLSCFSTHSRLGQCGYCGEDIAPGDNHADTSLNGCLFCEGTWGKVKDE